MDLAEGRRPGPDSDEPDSRVDLYPEEPTSPRDAPCDSEGDVITDSD
jgi:hypothetical protein